MEDLNLILCGAWKVYNSNSYSRLKEKSNEINWRLAKVNQNLQHIRSKKNSRS